MWFNSPILWVGKNKKVSLREAVRKYINSIKKLLLFDHEVTMTRRFTKVRNLILLYFVYPRDFASSW